MNIFRQYYFSEMISCLLMFLMISCSSNSNGEITGNYTIESPEDISNLSKYSRITGNLFINPDPKGEKPPIESL